MKGDKFFMDIVGKRGSTVRGIVRQGQTYFVARDVCQAARISYPKSMKTKLQPGERTRGSINGRSLVIVSIAGLIGLVPNRPEYDLARQCVAELIRWGAVKQELEETPNTEQ